jgi:hypothetical protein
MVAGGLPGCDRSVAPSASSDATAGRLQVALTATSVGGTAYRLAGASFLISSQTSAFSAVLTGDAPTLERTLPPGSYTIQILSGYTLNQVAPDGTETAVPATLASANVLPFGIRSQHVTAVSFEFMVGDAVVAMGDGTVKVSTTVDDGLIDDFEDGDGKIANIAGRSGTWFTFNDGSGKQTPAPGEAISPEVDPYTTNFYLHTSGVGFATSTGSPSTYGAGVGANLLEVGGTPTPYDASGYGGVTFSYRLSGNQGQVRLNVATSATTPVAEGGTCTTGCSDDFGFSLSSYNSYYCYYYPGYSCSVTIPFAQLAQSGFGTPATFDPTTILSVKWLVSWPYYSYPPIANAFDLTLDDVAFVSPAKAISNVGGGFGTGGTFGGTGGTFGGTGGRFGGTGGTFGGTGGTFGSTGGAPLTPPGPPSGSGGATFASGTGGSASGGAP